MISVCAAVLVLTAIIIVAVYVARRRKKGRVETIKVKGSHAQGLSSPLVVTGGQYLSHNSAVPPSPLGELRTRGPLSGGLVIPDGEIQKHGRIGAGLCPLSNVRSSYAPVMLSMSWLKLATGAAGQVFEGRFGDSRVALKEIYQNLMSGDIDAVSKEAHILASLRHPNIVTFYGMWEHLDAELCKCTIRCPFLSMQRSGIF